MEGQTRDGQIHSPDFRTGHLILFMLFLIPIILFGLTSVALALLRLRGMRMAYIWLLPAIITLVCWILFLVLPVPATASVLKIPWLYSLAKSGSLVFNLDSQSLGFIFILVSLILGYFLTLPIRLEKEKRTLLWIGWMLLSISAIFAFTAANILTLILAWTLFDLLDFIFTFFVLRTVAEEESLSELFIQRIISVSLLIVVFVFLEPGSSQLIPNSLQLPAYFLILFAAIFRTGLLPFRQIKGVEDQAGFSFDFLKKIAMVISGFSLLSHLPANFLNGLSNSLLSTIFLVLALVFTFTSLSRTTVSHTTWLDGVICLAIISVFSGNPQSLLNWAGVVLTGAGVLQFYSMRSPRFNLFALIGVLAVSGLPFTLGLAALNGLSSKGSLTWELICVPIYAVLLLDLIKKIITPPKEYPSVEPWYQAVYLFGLFLLALSPFALIMKSTVVFHNGFENWWIGGSVSMLTLTALLLDNRQKTLQKKLEKYSLKLIPILSFLRFHWLNGIWKWVSLIITEVFSFITQLLEGEGGVIWAIVIMALLVSIIGAGRS
jgi:hypothetical protein